MEPKYEELAKSLHGSPVRVAKYQADVDKEYCTQHLSLKTFPTIVYLPKGSKQVIYYPSERRDAETLSMWVNTMAGKVVAA